MKLQQLSKKIQNFIQMESVSGLLLMTMALLALVLDNSPLSWLYHQLLNTQVSLGVGQWILAKPLLHWINDGLMAIFFLLVGLEIKREILQGELDSIQKMALPGIAAIGGMLCPALIYMLFNHHDALSLQGWAIPTATDIAFSLGILMLLGSRIPSSLKIFLTALAILDDLGAVIIIAVFYTKDLSYISLGFATLWLLILFLLNFFKITKPAPYVVVGIFLWFCVLKSGVHATLAGVALAFAIPLQDSKRPEHSPLRAMEIALHPWVAFAILPLFAFANAGVSFQGMSLATFAHAIPLGIIFGLFIGKQLGVFGACWLAVKLKWAHLPRRCQWSQLYGVAILCGIGFTMSLFIGGLAFGNLSPEYTRYLRLGVLCGSLLSAIIGYAWLRYVKIGTRKLTVVQT